MSQPDESLVLDEYKNSDPIELSPDERDSLKELVPQITVKAAEGEEGRYELNPGGTVGAIQLGEKRFVLRPKIGIHRLAFVLAYSMDPRHWRQSGFDFTEDADIFEAVVPGFLFQLEEALRRGHLLGYRPEEDALQTVRGRIRFDDQIRARFGILPPIECRFDEYTEDIEINRILKAAIERLGRIRLRAPHTRQRLRAAKASFGNVASVVYHARGVPNIAWDRLTERFRPATELARLILRSRSLEFRAGKRAGAAFILDMSGVFETFVVVALRETLGLTASTFPQQASGRELYLDEGRRLRLRPDLSWWKGGQCIFVGDAKYKRTPEVAGVQHPDAYQLLAYTTATGLERGVLVYSADDESSAAAYSIPQAGKTLEVHTLDLDQLPEQVLAQMGVLGARIRTLAGVGPVAPQAADQVGA